MPSLENKLTCKLYACKAGEYELIFRSIGYKLTVKKIDVSAEPLIVNAILHLESYQLKEATVKANAEDPAYEIIRKAQNGIALQFMPLTQAIRNQFQTVVDDFVVREFADSQAT